MSAENGAPCCAHPKCPGGILCCCPPAEKDSPRVEGDYCLTHGSYQCAHLPDPIIPPGGDRYVCGFDMGEGDECCLDAGHGGLHS